MVHEVDAVNVGNRRVVSNDRFRRPEGCIQHLDLIGFFLNPRRARSRSTSRNICLNLLACGSQMGCLLQILSSCSWSELLGSSRSRLRQSISCSFVSRTASPTLQGTTSREDPRFVTLGGIQHQHRRKLVSLFSQPIIDRYQ